jgi:hypothetical protein
MMETEYVSENSVDFNLLRRLWAGDFIELWDLKLQQR